MKKLFLLLLLTGFSLLPAQLLAEEQTGSEPPRGEVVVSVEDQKVIELLELLQMMELLQDFQVMTLAEEKK
jgi:hypothetical protein